MSRRKLRDVVATFFIFLVSLLSLIVLVMIVYDIFSKGMIAFREVGFKNIIFGIKYYPTMDPPSFGIFNFIVSSLFVTLGSIMVGLPLGVGSALFLSEYADLRTKELLKPFIEILSSIPSVIFGFIGIVFIGPFIRRFFNIPTGLNLFTASFILGIVIVPIISSLTEDALSTVPITLKEASYALGGTKFDTITRVIIPYTKGALISALLLGVGRSIGETMIVLMVAGGAMNFPNSIFSPVRPLTATIAAEMGETAVGTTHFYVLYGIALVLLFLTLLLTLISNHFIKNLKRD
ncbi:MAG: phosphate ABC transporter permease subunit PstC [bacterium]|nr:phosphate ABC transporter permease subunit PstC [bacterium]